MNLYIRLHVIKTFLTTEEVNDKIWKGVSEEAVKDMEDITKCQVLIGKNCYNLATGSGVVASVYKSINLQ